MLAIQTESGATVVAIGGRLDGTTVAAAEPAVAEALGTGQGIVLDLAGLTYVASVGLRLVLMAAKRAAQSGQGLAVCALQPPVREVFEVAGLDMLITICASRQEALALVCGAP